MYKDLLGQAFDAMRHDMRKTILTMLGMAWGIATVVLLLAYGDGFGRAVQNIFENFGATAVGIFPGRTSQQAGGNKAGMAVRFTSSDTELLHNVVPLARYLSRQIGRDGIVQVGSRTNTYSIAALDPSIQNIWNLKIDDGRFLDDQDNFSHALVAVLGSQVKTELFSGMDAIGEFVRINGISFQVIGVAAPRMQEGGESDINGTVYIPFESMSVLQSTKYIGGYWMDSRGLEHDKMAKDIRDALALAHGFKSDDRRAVFIFDAQKQLAQFSIITLGIKILLTFIGTVTLGIGGVGLMNIMLVSVTQRTREIGVEKALGARKKDILFQFLSEALVITALGGVLGVLLSYAVSLSVGRLTLYSAVAQHAEAGDIRLIVAPKILMISTAILALVGVASGMFPAVRAANLDPIEALRHE